MSHEIQKHKKHESYDSYEEEDEIDLLEVLKKFIDFCFRNFKLIVITTIIVTVVFALLGRTLSRGSRQITAKIRVSKDIGETGKYPNGAAFDKNTLISDKELKELYSKYSLDKDFETYEDYVDAIVLDELSLDPKLIEKGMKNYEYKLSFAYSDAKKGKKFLKELMLLSKQRRIEEQIPPIVSINTGDIIVFDYMDRSGALNKYVLFLKKRIGALQNSSITNGLENQLFILAKGEVYDYTSYLLKNKLTNDIEKFKINTANRIYKLEDDIEKIKDKIAVLKDVIEVYKMQIAKDSSGAFVADKYYSNLIDEYKDLNNQLLKNREDLKEYKEYVSQVRGTTDKEEKELTDKLTKIINELSAMKKNVDEISGTYYSKIYSDLFVLNSEIEAVSKIKSVLIMALGMFLGAFLGMVIAFVKELHNSKTK